MPARNTPLELNRPGDAHERAADATASRVASSQGSQTLGVPAVLSNEAGEARTRLPAPRQVHNVLTSSGQSLNPLARAFFEHRFAREFGDVRQNGIIGFAVPAYGCVF